MPIIRVAFVLGLRDFGPKMFNWVQEMFNIINTCTVPLNAVFTATVYRLNDVLQKLYRKP